MGCSRQVARYEGTWVFDGCFDRSEHGLACAVSTSSFVCCFKSHPEKELRLSIRKQTAQVVLTSKRLPATAIEQSCCTAYSSRPQHELRALRTLMLRSIAKVSQRLRAACIKSESRLIRSLGDCRGGRLELARASRASPYSTVLPYCSSVPSFSLTRTPYGVKPWETPDPQALLVNIILGMPVADRRSGTRSPPDIIFPKLRSHRPLYPNPAPSPQRRSSRGRPPPKELCFKTSPISVRGWIKVRLSACGPKREGSWKVSSGDDKYPGAFGRLRLPIKAISAFLQNP